MCYTDSTCCLISIHGVLYSFSLSGFSQWVFSWKGVFKEIDSWMIMGYLVFAGLVLDLNIAACCLSGLLVFIYVLVAYVLFRNGISWIVFESLPTVAYCLDPIYGDGLMGSGCSQNSLMIQSILCSTVLVFWTL